MNPPRIIHNKRNIERHFSILGQLASQYIDKYSFEPAVFKKDDGKGGVREAHQNIVKKYYDAEEITIFEDDIIFTSSESWETYWEHYKELPKDWDVYLGGVYGPKELVDATQNLNKVNKPFCGIHWYTIRKKFYDKFLMCDERKHIDRWINHVGANTYIPKLVPSRQAEITWEKWAHSERRSKEGKRTTAHYPNARSKITFLD